MCAGGAGWISAGGPYFSRRLRNVVRDVEWGAVNEIIK